jgi:hypothetical protein
VANTILFPDTNVLLHCTVFDEIDWRSLSAGDEIVVALSLKVLSELDRKKRDGPQKVRDRAKQITRKIHELLGASDRVRLKNGVDLWVCPARKLQLQEHGLNADEADEVIIATVLDRRGLGDDAAIVTSDVSMLLRARQFNVPVLMAPEHWARPDDPDDVERTIQQLRRENEKLRYSAPNLRVQFKDDVLVKIERPKRTPLTQTQIDAAVADLQAKIPMIEVDEDDAVSIAREISRGGPTVRQVQKYNRDLTTYFHDYRDYLARAHTAFGDIDRTIPISLRVCNTGTRTAQDISLFVTANASGQWRRREPKLTVAPPERPQRPRPFAVTSMNPGATLPPSFQGLGIQPNIQIHDVTPRDPMTLHCEVRRINPGECAKIPKTYFQFPAPDHVQAFNLSYRLTQANMPPSEGRLHVTFTDVTD